MGCLYMGFNCLALFQTVFRRRSTEAHKNSRVIILRHLQSNVRLMAICSYRTLLSQTTPCGQFSDYPGHFECVPLKDSTKDITGQLASLKLSTDEGIRLN